MYKIFFAVNLLLFRFQNIVLAECDNPIDGGLYNRSIELYNAHGQYCIINNSLCSGISIIESSLYYSYITNNDFDCNIYQPGHGSIFVSNSTIRELGVSDNKFKTLIASFNYDTIFSLGFLKADEPSIKKSELFLRFNDCYFDGPLTINLPYFKVIISFRNCHFNDNFSLKATVDSIKFNDCIIENRNPISLTASNDSVRISFDNFDIEKAKFDYLPNFKIVFEDDFLSEERKNNVYQRLIAKYKAEYLKDSERNVAVEHELYKRNFMSTSEKLWSQIQSYWWNYGYSKERIIFFTAKIICIFYLINLLFWKWLKHAYRIDLPIRKEFKNRLLFYLGQIVNVFIYTSLIFFSLRVDFDKLEYKSPHLVLWFFLQYIIGLFCVFFIVNWLFKI